MQVNLTTIMSSAGFNYNFYPKSVMIFISRWSPGMSHHMAYAIAITHCHSKFSLQHRIVSRTMQSTVQNRTYTIIISKLPINSLIWGSSYFFFWFCNVIQPWSNYGKWLGYNILSNVSMHTLVSSSPSSSWYLPCSCIQCNLVLFTHTLIHCILLYMQI